MGLSLVQNLSYHDPQFKQDLLQRLGFPSSAAELVLTL